MFKNKNRLPFACFSPPVMVATFIFEFVSMLYVFYRYKLNSKTRIVAALLLCLSIFQLAEYMVCQKSSIAEISSRIGYVAITFLPVLGLHLLGDFTKNKNKRIITASYALALFISGYFLIHPESFKSYECTGNYVIFQIGQVQAWVYSAYYFGLLLYTLISAVALSKKSNKKVKSAINWLITGYLVFILPVAIIIILHPDSRRAVPSILCGFAILLAIILVAKISPKILKKR